MPSQLVALADEAVDFALAFGRCRPDLCAYDGGSPEQVGAPRTDPQARRAG